MAVSIALLLAICRCARLDGFQVKRIHLGEITARLSTIHLSFYHLTCNILILLVTSLLDQRLDLDVFLGFESFLYRRFTKVLSLNKADYRFLI